MEYVATIGMFDGVHRGHQFVLQHVVREARERGMLSMAVTFDRTADQTLTPLAVKRQLLAAAGIDRIEVLPFTDALKRMTAREFMEQVLRDRFSVKVLLTGYDNRFGHNRAEGFDDYVRYGAELGMEVRCLPPLPTDSPQTTTVSSSLIRQLLLDGQVAEAARCLGRDYTLTGCVTHGEHIGTQIGFPTANIVPDSSHQLPPAPSAYAVTVCVEGIGEKWNGMMNIGSRPTFDGHQQTLEVNIFGFHDDLYGRRVVVSFVERLRSEQRFDSVEALQEQLKKDALRAEQLIERRKDEE